ncbi:MAG: hypothetical protein RL095_3420 [Verrucomicrobiota bacterium]|jgi:pantoate--beta-alanine ligase
MQIIETVNEIRQLSRAWKREGRSVGCVPTMGALHEGHISLVKEARRHGASRIVVTIFVNPTQFGPNEDFSRYPRTIESDLQACAAAGVAAVYVPSVDEMYRRDASCWVQEEKLSLGLCGPLRPGHFRGVATVVLKLLNAVEPDLAVFGEKDFQQLAVIRRMVRDLDHGCEILGAPTLRDPDGLAMSSRNRYLNPEERQRALALPKALQGMRRELAANPVTPPSVLLESARALLATVDARIDYIEIVDSESLAHLDTFDGVRSARAIAAVRIGTTRLIDNLALFG